jgi:hypothetical protein
MSQQTTGQGGGYQGGGGDRSEGYQGGSGYQGGGDQSVQAILSQILMFQSNIDFQISKQFDKSVSELISTVKMITACTKAINVNVTAAVNPLCEKLDRIATQNETVIGLLTEISESLKGGVPPAQPPVQLPIQPNAQPTAQPTETGISAAKFGRSPRNVDEQSAKPQDLRNPQDSYNPLYQQYPDVSQDSRYPQDIHVKQDQQEASYSQNSRDSRYPIDSTDPRGQSSVSIAKRSDFDRTAARSAQAPPKDDTIQSLTGRSLPDQFLSNKILINEINQAIISNLPRLNQGITGKTFNVETTKSSEGLTDRTPLFAKGPSDSLYFVCEDDGEFLLFPNRRSLAGDVSYSGYFGIIFEGVPDDQKAVTIEKVVYPAKLQKEGGKYTLKFPGMLQIHTN